MSWLARSVANALLLEDEEEEVEDVEEKTIPDDIASLPPADRQLDSTLSAAQSLLSYDNVSDANVRDEDTVGDYSQGRGVKEDLSEFRDSLTRQFWGVALFLAPPPPPEPFGRRSDLLLLESDYYHSQTGTDDEEVENEEAEEHDSRLSGQLSPSEAYYAKIVDEAVGITDEVLAFARNIAHHPETWLDFPISEEEDFDNFGVSDAQYKHALAVEHLAPRLAALRIELCPVHMSEGYFWMVYFVLLHSRLNKHDADLLSSPQLVQARAMWMQALQKQPKELYGLGMSRFHLKESSESAHENFVTCSYDDAHFKNVSDHIPRFESSMHELIAVEKHPVNEIEFIDKSVISEDLVPKSQEKEIVASTASDDDWLKEDSDLIGYPGPSIVVNEEDISFSDLEDDLDCAGLIKYKAASAKENITTQT